MLCIRIVLHLPEPSLALEKHCKHTVLLQLMGLRTTVICGSNQWGGLCERYDFMRLLPSEDSILYIFLNSAYPEKNEKCRRGFALALPERNFYGRFPGSIGSSSWKSCKRFVGIHDQSAKKRMGARTSSLESKKFDEQALCLYLG